MAPDWMSCASRLGSMPAGTPPGKGGGGPEGKGFMPVGGGGMGGMPLLPR